MEHQITSGKRAAAGRASAFHKYISRDTCLLVQYVYRMFYSISRAKRMAKRRLSQDRLQTRERKREQRRAHAALPLRPRGLGAGGGTWPTNPSFMRLSSSPRNVGRSTGAPWTLLALACSHASAAAAASCSGGATHSAPYRTRRAAPGHRSPTASRSGPRLSGPGARMLSCCSSTHRASLRRAARPVGAGGWLRASKPAQGAAPPVR